jgi:glyoxylase-like metal-dependent hydrolase (beta-lactamase superfamily II)
MRVRKPGKIRDQLWFLGAEESCVYLLEGTNESMIISGGLSYLVPEILKQFEEFRIDETRIGKLLILHSHFDHGGIVPFFKRRNPKLQVYASARGWEILRMPRAIQTFNQFSHSVARRGGKEEILAGYDLDWKEGITGIPVFEGDRIDLGNLDVLVMETPGHSSCSISAYVPRLRALFPSDAGGIPYRDMIIASGNSNFTQYQQSLEKLRNLQIDYVCADHYGYVAGEEARGFIQKTIEVAKQERSLMETAYRRIGNIDSAAQELTRDYYHKHPDWVVSSEIVEGVYRQMLRHIAGTLSSPVEGKRKVGVGQGKRG